MGPDEEFIEAIAVEVAKRLRIRDHSVCIPVGISNRHVHLTAADLEILFGKGYQLTVENEVKQPGQFAARETVCIAGAKGSFANVRILGPVRKYSQIEISRTDAYLLGIKPPVRISGDTQAAASLSVIGPQGILALNARVICAWRHIHMAAAEAERFGVNDGDLVEVETAGTRRMIFGNVLIRVSPHSALEFHIDTDEANAADVKNGDLVGITGKTGDYCG